MKSVGVMMGWNENLHTLGPPWQRLDIPALIELGFFPLVVTVLGLERHPIAILDQLWAQLNLHLQYRHS